MALKNSANIFFSKLQSAHQDARTFGWITSIYPDAISYTAGPPGLRGLVFFIGIFIFSLFTPLGLWSAISDFEFYGRRFFDYLMIFISIGFSAAGVGFLIFSIRFELFRPLDEPTLFDRKNRKVHLIRRKVYPGPLGLLKAGPYIMYVMTGTLLMPSIIHPS